MSGTKREQRLREAGYRFNGHYYRYGEHQAALEKAAEYRAQGTRAQVVTVVSRGRICNSEGYSIYIKQPPQRTTGG